MRLRGRRFLSFVTVLGLAAGVGDAVVAAPAEAPQADAAAAPTVSDDVVASAPSGSAAGPDAPTQGYGDFSRPDPKPSLIEPFTAEQIAAAKRAGKEGFVEAESVLVSRSATTDTFANPDGTFTAKVSATPVNFKDASGMWVRLDPSLKPDASGRFETVATPVRLSVASSADDPEAVRLSGDGWSFGWSLGAKAERRESSVSAPGVVSGVASDGPGGHFDLVADPSFVMVEATNGLTPDEVAKADPATGGDKPVAPGESGSYRVGMSSTGVDGKADSVKTPPAEKPVAGRGVVEPVTLADGRTANVGFRYPGAVAGGSVEVESGPYGMRSQIVLTDASSARSGVFEFPVAMKGVSLRQAKDGSVEVVTDKGVVVVSFKPGTAWDATFNAADGSGASTPVAVSVKADPKTGSQLVWSVDPEWLASPERVFPVVIDPQATYVTPNANVIDGFVSSGAPTSYFDGNNQIDANAYTDKVGTTAGTEFISYQYFDLSAMAGRQIVSATWNGTSYSTANSVNGLVDVSLRPLAGSFTSPSLATWNSRPQVRGTGTQPTGSMIGINGTSTGNGYWLNATDGGVFAYGDAQMVGNPTGTMSYPTHYVTGFDAKSTNAYTMVAENGWLWSYGGIADIDQPNRLPANPWTDVAADPSSNGFWVLGPDGSVYSDGGAAFYGSAVNISNHGTLVAMTAKANGGGYWLANSVGAVYSFGNAGFYGNATGLPLNAPIIDIVSTRLSRVLLK